MTNMRYGRTSIVFLSPDFFVSYLLGETLTLPFCRALKDCYWLQKIYWHIELGNFLLPTFFRKIARSSKSEWKMSWSNTQKQIVRSLVIAYLTPLVQRDPLYSSSSSLRSQVHPRWSTRRWSHLPHSSQWSRPSLKQLKWDRGGRIEKGGAGFGRVGRRDIMRNWVCEYVIWMMGKI